MSTPLLVAILWVFAATGTAFLPLRLQIVPGVALLIAAPALIVWIGLTHGLWVAAFATFAVLSMFRIPLRALLHKALRR